MMMMMSASAGVSTGSTVVESSVLAVGDSAVGDIRVCFKAAWLVTVRSVFGVVIMLSMLCVICNGSGLNGTDMLFCFARFFANTFNVCYQHSGLSF